jgi:hypothetical protein
MICAYGLVVHMALSFRLFLIGSNSVIITGRSGHLRNGDQAMLRIFQLIAILAVVVLFVATFGVAFYSPPYSGKPSEQKTSTEQEPRNQEQEQGITSSAFWRFLFPDSISVFTFWLVLATIILAIVAVIQIGFLTRQEQISVKTAQAAKDSADAAKGAIVLSGKTAERQLRAYIGVTTNTRVPNLVVGKKQEAGIFFTNYGQTPANKTRYWGDVQIREYPLNAPLPSLDFRSDILPINPNQKIPIAFETISQLTSEEEAKLRAGTGRFYLYGEIEYFDVFGEKRITTFRFSYGGSLLIGLGIFTVDEEGNDAK